MKLYLILGFIGISSTLVNSQDLKLGLLATTHLDKDPTGQSPSEGPSGRLISQCCCALKSSPCPIVIDGDDYFDYEDDLVGSGIINPRLGNATSSDGVGVRIANRPGPSVPFETECPSNRQKCCYNVASINSIRNQCIPLGSNREQWKQGCRQLLPSGGRTCGTRNFLTATGRKHGESSPGEFPWTCLLLNQNNDFIGSCVVIPSSFTNDLSSGTRKVLTAAHKLNSLKSNDQLKVRVGEYDASGFNRPETVRHEEYIVQKFIVHPDFSSKRLSNDIALLTVDRHIVLSDQVSAACFPACDHMFGYQFKNGTGVRCWVSGWGKDAIDGSFQAIQHKVDVPLVNDQECQRLLKDALTQKNPAAGNRFRLDKSEICAGGEPGKDACDGDGGAPLVCESNTGHWNVVGLVTWGVGCARKDVPGVYARISHFKNWIESN